MRAEAFAVKSRVCLTWSVCGHKEYYLLPVLWEPGKTKFETACVFLGLVIVSPGAFIPCEGPDPLMDGDEACRGESFGGRAHECFTCQQAPSAAEWQDYAGCTGSCIDVVFGSASTGPGLGHLLVGRDEDTSTRPSLGCLKTVLRGKHVIRRRHQWAAS